MKPKMIQYNAMKQAFKACIVNILALLYQWAETHYE